jgi:DMSO/TMAO reductase YedYZ molybdopterin-dependent catalytic subunit
MHDMHKSPELSLLVIGIILPAVVIAGCSAPSVGSLADTWHLTINGTTEKVLNMNDIRAMPAVTGFGYAVSTTGTRFGPYTCKGVDLKDIAALAGGVGPRQQVWVSAPDGYLWVFDSDQLQGNGFVTFNVNLTEIPAPPLRIILMYEQNGTPLTYDEGGPLRIAIISEQPGVVTEGSAWVKWVDRIEIHD